MRSNNERHDNQAGNERALEQTGRVDHGDILLHRRGENAAAQPRMSMD